MNFYPAKMLLFILFLFAFAVSCSSTQDDIKVGALDHFRRGNAYFNANRPKAAAKEYKIAIALDSSREQFYYNLGLAYYSLVLFKQAIDAYWKAIELKPDFADAWYNLSLAFEKINETDKAFMAYQKYQKLNLSKEKKPSEKTDNKQNTDSDG